LEDWETDHQLYRGGVLLTAGITHPELEELRGDIGLDAWQALRQRLVELAQAVAEQDAIEWPRSYRYTGKPFKHFIPLDGGGLATLEPGDVASLDERQAAAWADGFELVVESPTAGLDKAEVFTPAVGLRPSIAIGPPRGNHCRLLLSRGTTPRSGAVPSVSRWCAISLPRGTGTARTSAAMTIVETLGGALSVSVIVVLLLQPVLVLFLCSFLRPLPVIPHRENGAQADSDADCVLPRVIPDETFDSADNGQIEDC
jgi:hypothetical protein